MVLEWVIVDYGNPAYEYRPPSLDWGVTPPSDRPSLVLQPRPGGVKRRRPPGMPPAPHGQPVGPEAGRGA